jgi:hypothetical protein
MRALDRSRRRVQEYLRMLEAGGYIVRAVIASKRSRMCVGLVPASAAGAGAAAGAWLAGAAQESRGAEFRAQR